MDQRAPESVGGGRELWDAIKPWGQKLSILTGGGSSAEASKPKWCQNNIGEPGKDYHSVIVVVAKNKQNGGRAGPGGANDDDKENIQRWREKEASACIIRGARRDAAGTAAPWTVNLDVPSLPEIVKI